MKELETSKITLDTKEGKVEVEVHMGINWGTSQPIYEFKYKGYCFTTIRGDIASVGSTGVKVKICDKGDFEYKISNLIKEIRRHHRILNNQERMYNA